MALIEIDKDSSNAQKNALYQMINNNDNHNRDVSIERLISRYHRKPQRGRFYGITESGYNLCFAAKYTSAIDSWRIHWIGYSGTLPGAEEAIRVLLTNIRTIMIQRNVNSVYFLFQESGGHAVQNAIRNVIQNAWERDGGGGRIGGRNYEFSLEKNNTVRRIIITDNNL